MKSRPKNKGRKFVPQQKKRNLKTVSPEVLFAQKLAANDPILRNRAVKKLEKWLRLRSDLLTKDEVLRVWKGLHYCFWMSDKPLVQEELAESISRLIHCFPKDSNTALLFIESGLVTEGREWVGIDQWRMDKFMMFMRRFLRQIFTFLQKSEWSKVKDINEIISKRGVSNDKATLGFRLHFTDIFLEELAKIGGENLPSEIILQLTQPFAKELAEGEDDRLAKHIVERIYQHLMRQSDVGIANEEALDGDDQEPEESEPGEEDNDDDEKMGSESSEDEDELSEIVQDPRAGNVSVTLPQLQPNFDEMADELFKVGSQKQVASRRRKLLYDLTKQFKDLVGNVYPLIPDLSGEESNIPKLKVTKLAAKKAQEDLQMQEKNRQEREDFKKAKKRKFAPVPQENEAEDKEAEPEVKEVEPAKDNKKKGKKEKLEASSSEESLNTAEVKSKKKKKKAKLDVNSSNESINSEIKKKKKKQKDGDQPEESSPKKDKKKRKANEAEPAKEVKKKKKKLKDSEALQETPTKSPEKKKKKKSSTAEESSTSTQKDTGEKLFGDDNDWGSSEAKITPLVKGSKSALFLKKSKSAEIKSVKQQKNHISLLEERKRRISFALSQNKCQSFNDIDRSMQDSPDIPYLPEKQPKQGVLKTKSANSTPNNLTKAALSYNTMMNGKSKAAKKLGINSSRMLFRF